MEVVKMAIIVDSSFLPRTERNKMIALRRITEEELNNLVLELSSKAEGYIKVYTFGKLDKIPDEIVREVKQLYIGWKLYAEIEYEQESKDKKDSMIELLEVMKDNILQEIKSGKDINEDKDVIRAKGIKFS